MKTITMLELRREFPKVLRWLTAGKETLRLTYRGKPVADLMPVRSARSRPPKDDPFYRMAELAVDGQGLSNEEIDATLYGKTEAAG